MVWDKEMNNYADNKLKTKCYKIVLNNIKFKLILRMFAVVKKGEMYVENYRNAAWFKNKFGSLCILEYANA